MRTPISSLIINGKCTYSWLPLPARLKEGCCNRTTMAWKGDKMAIAPPLAVAGRVGSSVRLYSTMARALADVGGGRSSIGYRKKKQLVH